MKNTLHMIQLKDVDTIRMYSDNYNAGSIFLTSDTNKVYVLNQANEVIEVVNTDSNSKSHITHTKPTNCKNCGAVLTSYKCEYCGTEY
jgi:hypothetical protein